MSKECGDCNCQLGDGEWLCVTTSPTSEQKLASRHDTKEDATKFGERLDVPFEVVKMEAGK